MKWHNLLLLLASLMLIAVASAQDIEIPDDIDDEDLDEDEEILRLLEEKRIVSVRVSLDKRSINLFALKISKFSWKI
jgi:hypothetical protein